ncbi:efflux RND transporter periplasmic adaptor subunit [Microbulbifer epialgicus]|uniref:Efflux RND transporter periplasmic adaptor subunit n=1 Tax=Microbulbifer epialgicus TaxID=393907 RepID=A0ABV4P2G0_9GAMM
MDILRTDLEIAEHQLSHAEEELARLIPLREAQMVSPSQLNDLKLSANTHRLNKQRLKQQLEIDQYRFDRLKHFAPRDSQVLQVEAHPGERLTQGQRILQLLPLDEKQLECRVTRDQIGTNAPIEYSDFLYDGKPLTLRNIGRTMDQDTQNLSLYFDGHGDHFESLLVGQRFQIAMLTPTESLEQIGKITKLPSDAVLLEEGKYHTWALGHENRVRRVEVEILDTLADHFIVMSEIQPGDQLVVLGHGNLQAGQEVVPVDGDS